MKNARYLPCHPLLKKIVRFFAFQSFDGTGNSQQWTRLFPNCTTNICVIFDSEFVSKEAGNMQSNISTSCIRPVTFNRSSTIEMMVIQFEPYGFHWLTGVPMNMCKNQFFHLDDFFSASVLESLYQQLFSAKDDLRKVKLLENFVLSQVNSEDFDDRVIFASNLICQNPQIKLDELIEHLNLSARRLRDLFAMHLGISPKYFLRLSRFNQITREVSHGHDKSLTEIALANGYFDQAHFIKEFREFGGLSPKQFLQLEDKTADFYNFES